MLRLLKSALGTGLVALALAAPTAPAAAEEPAAVHAAAAEGPSHGEHKANPMEIQPGLAIWTVAVFAGLMAVLGKFAWKPLVEALHHREEHLEHCLLQTEKARNDAEQLLAEHRRLMTEADDKVRDILFQAQRKAETRSADILRQAQADADASRDRAQREIVAARDQALSEIWTRTADLAVSVAGRVLAKQIGEDDRSRLLDEAIRELPEGSPKSGGARA